MTKQYLEKQEIKKRHIPPKKCRGWEGTVRLFFFF